MTAKSDKEPLVEDSRYRLDGWFAVIVTVLVLVSGGFVTSAICMVFAVFFLAYVLRVCVFFSTCVRYM